MPVHKLVWSLVMDTDFPRDRLITTAHFEHTGALVDMDGFCGAAAAAMNTAWVSGGTAQKIEVRSYDAQGSKPVYPDGYGVVNPSATPRVSGMPRDIALCLSYYADRNVPRHRGRMYLPVCASAGLSAPGKFPDTTITTRALDLASALAGLGGIDVNWVVWSKMDGDARNVTTAWVDNEWDTQRRRGLRATSRTTRNVGA